MARPESYKSNRCCMTCEHSITSIDHDGRFCSKGENPPRFEAEAFRGLFAIETDEYKDWIVGIQIPWFRERSVSDNGCCDEYKDGYATKNKNTPR
jgi:hypothetical protein